MQTKRKNFSILITILIIGAVFFSMNNFVDSNDTLIILEQIEFVEQMYLKEVPKYGWKTIPVTLEINHSEFGKVGLKTEIYEPEQFKPKIIVEQK